MFDKFFNDSSEKTVIYCPVGTFKRVQDLFNIIFPGDFEKVYSNSNVEFREFERLENEEVLPGFFVTSFDVEHGSFKPAFGYTIKNGDKTLGISGDSRLCSSIEKIVQKSDLSVLDVSFVEEGISAHMGLPDIDKIYAKFSDAKIIPTHMHDDTKEAANGRKSDNFIVLNDGDIFEF